jgi:hypothetical protein
MLHELYNAENKIYGYSKLLALLLSKKISIDVVTSKIP